MTVETMTEKGKSNKESIVTTMKREGITGTGEWR